MTLSRPDRPPVPPAPASAADLALIGTVALSRHRWPHGAVTTHQLGHGSVIAATEHAAYTQLAGTATVRGGNAVINVGSMPAAHGGISAWGDIVILGHAS